MPVAQAAVASIVARASAHVTAAMGTRERGANELEMSLAFGPIGIIGVRRTHGSTRVSRASAK